MKQIQQNKKLLQHNHMRNWNQYVEVMYVSVVKVSVPPWRNDIVRTEWLIETIYF